jgi:heme/copper-type cytochrome/quinol oxidase subunit 1
MGRRLFFRKKRTPAVPTAPLLQRLAGHARVTTNIVWCRAAYVVTNWILSTNHRRIATMYFSFVLVTGFAGLALATLIRIELAYPGQVFMINNAERYLTIISLHGIIMVFFVVIPVLFGAFGNFLLPTQLGVRDVAFPRLNSIMFWVTPGGFVMLLHILVFDRMPSMMI